MQHCESKIYRDKCLYWQCQRGALTPQTGLKINLRVTSGCRVTSATYLSSTDAEFRLGPGQDCSFAITTYATIHIALGLRGETCTAWREQHYPGVMIYLPRASHNTFYASTTMQAGHYTNL